MWPSGKADLGLKDEAYDVPKPLIVAVQELGDVMTQVVNLMRNAAPNDEEQYTGGMYERTYADRLRLIRKIPMKTRQQS